MATINFPHRNRKNNNFGKWLLLGGAFVLLTFVLMSVFRPDTVQTPHWYSNGEQMPNPDWCNDPDLQTVANGTNADGIPSLDALDAAYRIANRAGISGTGFEIAGNVLATAALLCQ